jgi:cytochrome P450 family 9
MSSLAYELVCNPDIQQKLFEEIQAAENELDGKKVSYEKIQSLKYLDKCVSEILRKWTVAPVSSNFLNFYHSVEQVCFVSGH